MHKPLVKIKEMTKEYKTEIVETKEFNKIFMIVLGILYLISAFYIFVHNKENLNVYLKYLALAIYTSGIYFLLFLSSFCFQIQSELSNFRNPCI